MKICTGMRSVHFHLSGGVEFDEPARVGRGDAAARAESRFSTNLPLAIAERKRLGRGVRPARREDPGKPQYSSIRSEFSARKFLKTPDCRTHGLQQCGRRRWSTPAPQATRSSSPARSTSASTPASCWHCARSSDATLVCGGSTLVALQRRRNPDGSRIAVASRHSGRRPRWFANVAEFASTPVACCCRKCRSSANRLRC